METVTPKIQIVEETEDYGRFVVEPQERGYGTTLGSALRRVLLSSIPGAAITSIKIDGVLHEFSTIPGVKEDTTELILNLREVFVRDNTQGDNSSDIILRIDKKGPGTVTGADIETPPEVEVVNPEAYICTLAEANTSLSMEMTVGRGRGYVLPEKQENIKPTIGIIPVGSVFSPVRHVNYTVEATRVGHQTDFERLTIEVTTNGTVAPSDALSQAARILDKQLRLFFDFNRKGGADLLYQEEDQTIRIGPPDARIEELDFSVRTYNCLKKANIMTIGELVQRSEADLMQIRNFGKKSLNEVKDKLVGFGLSLKKGPATDSVDYDDLDDDENMDDDLDVQDDDSEDEEESEVDAEEDEIEADEEDEDEEKG